MIFIGKYSRRTVIKLESGHGFYRKKFKETKFLKNVNGVTFLFLCTSSGGGLYLYKVL